MAKFTTSKGRVVDHLHRMTTDREINSGDMAMLRKLMAEEFPKAEIVKESTIKYNCHGFSLAPRHEGWFNFPDLFITDDYDSVPKTAARPGDILLYGKNGTITHTSVVVEVEDGTILRVQSKWGRVNEVIHAVDVVPEIYGEPIVLLRPLPGLPLHPCVGGPKELDPPASETPGEMTAARDPEATTLSESTKTKIPERLMMMFASAPEVERLVWQSHHPGGADVGPQDGPSDPPAPPDVHPEAITLASVTTSETSSGEEEPEDELRKALKGLYSQSTQFQLMLASTPQVLRAAASELKPVKKLIELDKANKLETRKAIVKFFDRPKTQKDEELTGLTLFLLTKLPSKDAILPIARYLETGNFTQFNGDLAADALKAAIALS